MHGKTGQRPLLTNPGRWRCWPARTPVWPFICEVPWPYRGTDCQPHPHQTLSITLSWLLRFLVCMLSPHSRSRAMLLTSPVVC
eukprot:5348386-Pleurochrysis_carterae.AAC.1